MTKKTQPTRYVFGDRQHREVRVYADAGQKRLAAAIWRSANEEGWIWENGQATHLVDAFANAGFEIISDISDS